MSNALAGENSPYLLQHADNPVDWQPWSDEAFALAARREKLVFLSVGYSTCHWCHVMAHESFENEQVAAVLNHHFVCVKVDREERPDIDALYMSYLQATTGQGGWPMSVWLTPDGSPVYGGTYFPPDDRAGRAGLTRVCHELARLWRDDRSQLEDQAQRAMAHLRHHAAAGRPLGGPLTADDAIDTFLQTCISLYDSQHGGFGSAPKFPRPALLLTLLQLCKRVDPEQPLATEAWRMCDHTLQAMTDGGLHDQLGGGFHRYSVDRYWHVPHYEKMLYDQAQLALAYLEAWELSGEEKHRRSAEGIFHYLLGTMRDSAGAFHSAEDADSLPDHGSDHALEGAFWTWREEEIRAALEPQDAAVFIAAYDVRTQGNARPGSDPHGELAGRNTLYRASSPQALAAMFDCPLTEIEERLQRAQGILLGLRQRRPLPHRDDKILTAWNGLAIAALARGARVLERTDLCDAAAAAANFIRRELWQAGRLYRSLRTRRSEVPGMPADYVYLIQGLIELHSVIPECGWLEWALTLQGALDEECWDDALQGYVMRPMLQGRLLMAIREDYDGAEPSPNHVAILNLLHLAKLTGEACWRDRAEALLLAGQAGLKHPFAVPVLVAAVEMNKRAEP